MSELQGRKTTRQATDAPDNKGRHYDLIKSRINPVFKNASLRSVQELAAVKIRPAQWVMPTSHFNHDLLQAANLQLWSAHSALDRMFDELQDIYAFAEPLLSAALKKQYDVEDDVKTTYLHLYLPKDRPWYTLNITGGVTTRTVSLLEAALHNFATSETCEPDSDFISQPDERGLFDIKPIKRKMSIAQFQTLCRELDIGARYTRYLESNLLPRDAVAKSTLHRKVIDNEKAAFVAAAHLAFLTKDIDRNARDLVLAMLDGQHYLTLKGHKVKFAELSIMDTSLTGIVLIAPDLESAHRIEGLIAYIPGDPEHPLKEYASVTDFLNELTRQLREDAFIESAQMTYRQFFSRFVDQQQRGHFFAGLQERLFKVQWHQKEPLDQRPSWRETPVTNPKLQFSVTPLTGDLWEHLFQQKLNKILNDGRHIAVSTADTDSNARWAWWDNFKKIVSDIFNVALMVLTPFVPGLGELMMVYTAYQIANDVIESVVYLAEGLWTEGLEHVLAVVNDIAQLAAFAAGVKIGSLARLKISSLIEGMKPVELPNGQQRLWHPDLKPYEQPNLKLPSDSRPNQQGLHSHKGQDILALDKKHYAVQQDAKTGNYRIKHPQRSDAYLPELKHNDRGAWTHEAENPRSWDSPTLMRRLGHTVADLSDADLEQVRAVSGTEDNALRRMYVDNAAPPPLLDDSLNRFKLFKEAQQAGELIRTGQALPPSSYWFEPLPTYLEGWPADKALKVYESASKTGRFRHYGNPQASADQTLSTDLSHVMSGEWPQSIADFLDDKELTTLLGRQTPQGEQVQELRNRLGDEADKLKTDIFNQQYQAGETSGNSRVRQVRDTFPELPSRAAQTLLGHASAAELERMTQEQRLPLRLKNQAREWAFEARTSHAYEGFYDDALLNADTERLALNTLRIYTDAFDDLRIEVREGTLDGPLRCSVGEADAGTVRTLVRDEFAQYEVHGGQNAREAQGFFQAILQTLPAEKLKALGYRTGEGRKLKQWIMEKTAPPAERRTVLAEPPIRPIAAPEDVLLLRGQALTIRAKTLEERTSELYPHLNEREISTFVRSLGTEDEALLTLRRLDHELDALEVILNKWRYQQPDAWGPGANSFRDKGGLHLAERLVECFQRKPTVFGERSTTLEGGYALDLSSELARYDIEYWWIKLPELKPFIDQVTTLNLDRMSYSAPSDRMLKDFPHLRQLSARDCGLTELPKSIGKMHFLRTLRLMNNQIKLTASSVEQLRNLTHLETLRLDDNPSLGMLPNVERMPKLRVLSLSNTGATTWPEGLFKKRRPRGFFLDLQENPLKELPTVVRGSDDAFIVARTRLFERDLSVKNRIVYEDYRKSVGIKPTQFYTDAADDAIAQWPMDDDSKLWSPEVSGLGTYREEAWHDLMMEPESKGFFQLIQKQTLSADYTAGGEAKKQLSKRVWRMIEAIDLDSELRKDLFEMATSPTTCADAGAQVFNHMGIKVIAREAYALSTSNKILENKLVTLAKGAARLARVDDIARADYQSRPNEPEEVEVYLAYETGLAQRLGLPWQSEQMLFRLTAGVSNRAIDEAYDTVISMEAGDGLINDMIEQPFWEKYLRDTFPNEFARNARLFDHKANLLDELREAQRAWVGSKELDIEQRQLLKQRLQDLARQLNVAESVVVTEEEMTEEVYDGLLNDLGYERKELNRLLTREALQRAENN